MRFFLLASLAFSGLAFGQEPDVVLPFKKTDKGELMLHVFKPADWKADDSRPAIVFFFGGGWVSGTPAQFFPHCRHLAELGMVAISAQYRTRNSHGTDAFACVEDGKSAIRWVRTHAAELGVDPEKIAAGGGSAGGHVAACTGLIDGFDAPGEDTTISSKPQALALFNPVIDTSAEGWGHKAAGPNWEAISPNHHVTKAAPPTVVFHGTADTTVPHANVAAFAKKMKALAKRCDLHSYEGRAHGFFNAGRGDDSDYTDTVAKMDAFLRSLGFLKSTGR